ncbi:helix-turn-helix transcriptional regulator [Spirillospora sp. NPDC047279]|uniref:helix-turn-helix domain-containing protein n=1 Tax=Spirillospora sp. NPDC047279 TaxID=3155478 RepID=UPI0033DD637B
MLLGSQLRRLREEPGIRREEAGYRIRSSDSKIGRIELGRVGLRERDLRDLLDLYGVIDETERDAIFKLASEGNTPDWWHRYSDLLPSWFQTYIGLEEGAELIRAFENQFVPALLQTEDYARAVIRAGFPGDEEGEIERRVALRMERQRRLIASGAPRLWVVIDEAALLRPIGDGGVMRGQIHRLLEMNQETNVTIQVLPIEAGHVTEGCAFSLLRFPDRELPDVAYIRNLSGAVYLDKIEAVGVYKAAFNHMCVNSLDLHQTSDWLARSLRRG